MDRSRKVIKNTIWEMGYYLAVILLGFLAPRFIILVYGSEVNGLSSTITQIMNVILLLQSGATTAAVFSLYKPIAEEDTKEIRRNMASAEYFFKKISLIFAVVMLVVAAGTAFFIDSEIKEIYIFIAFVIMGMKSFLDLYFTSKFRIAFTAFQEKFFISIATLIEQVVYYALVFLTIYLRAHFLLMYVWFLIGCVVKVVYLEFAFKKKHADLVTNEYRQEKISIGGRNYAFANEVSHSIVASSPMIILSFMYGLEEASVYSVYALVSSGLSLFITALYSAFSPSFGNLLAQGDDEGSKRVFEIFQFLFNMFNTLIIMCMLYLIIPFVRLYTAGATDIDYINPLLAILLSFNGLVFAYRIPYNVVVSTCGFFKETWKQPVITACLSLAISIFLGKYNYSLILIGPIVFYIVNFVYQYFRLKGLVQHLISNSVFLMAIISIAGFILGLIAVDYASLPGGVAAWIAQAVIGLLASTGFIVLLSALLLRQELAASYNYLKSIVYRRM